MNLYDFIKYFSEILNEDVCDIIIDDLREKIPNDQNLLPRFVVGIQNKPESGIYKYLTEAIIELKKRYLKEMPQYLINHYHDVSGENFDVREVIHNKFRVHYYPTGGYVTEHVDNTGNRKLYMIENKELPSTEFHFAQLSCLLYLNDDYEGGEFVIIGQEYKPAKGSALIFPSNFMFPHKINKVTGGERWSVGAFLR